MSLPIIDLTTNAQNFTVSWVDLGAEISTETFNNIGLWLDIDINDTVDVRIRIVARHTSGGSDYVLPIKNITDSVVNIQDEYFELTSDIDQKIVIAFPLDEVIPCIQFQIQAGTVGATAGQILNSKYTIW